MYLNDVSVFILMSFEVVNVRTWFPAEAKCGRSGWFHQGRLI